MPRFNRFTLAAIAVMAAVRHAGGRRELAAVARARQPGDLERDAAPDRVGGRQEHRVEDGAARRALVADRLGRSDFRDLGGRRGGRARGESRRPHDGREGVRPSRQRGGRSQAHPEGAGDRREEREDPLGSHGVRRHRLRRASPPQQLRRADRGHRRHHDLRVLRPRGALRVRLLRHAGVESGREVQDARPRHRHVAGDIPEPGDHPARRERGKGVGHRGVRQAHRQRGLDDEAPGADQLEHAGPGARPGIAPSSSPTATSSSSATTRPPARSCGARPASRATPSTPRSSAKASSS